MPTSGGINYSFYKRSQQFCTDLEQSTARVWEILLAKLYLLASYWSRSSAKENGRFTRASDAVHRAGSPYYYVGGQGVRRKRERVSLRRTRIYAEEKNFFVRCRLASFSTDYETLASSAFLALTQQYWTNSEAAYQ